MLDSITADSCMSGSRVITITEAQHGARTPPGAASAGTWARGAAWGRRVGSRTRTAQQGGRPAPTPGARKSRPGGGARAGRRSRGPPRGRFRRPGRRKRKCVTAAGGGGSRRGVFGGQAAPAGSSGDRGGGGHRRSPGPVSAARDRLPPGAGRGRGRGWVYGGRGRTRGGLERPGGDLGVTTEAVGTGESVLGGRRCQGGQDNWGGGDARGSSAGRKSGGPGAMGVYGAPVRQWGGWEAAA